MIHFFNRTVSIAPHCVRPVLIPVWRNKLLFTSTNVLQWKMWLDNRIRTTTIVDKTNIFSHSREIFTKKNWCCVFVRCMHKHPLIWRWWRGGLSKKKQSISNENKDYFSVWHSMRHMKCHERRSIPQIGGRRCIASWFDTCRKSFIVGWPLTIAFSHCPFHMTGHSMSDHAWWAMREKGVWCRPCSSSMSSNEVAVIPIKRK